MAEHPRLLFGNTLAEVQQQSTTTHVDLTEALVGHAESAEPLPVATPDLQSHEYRQYGDSVGALAFACLLTDRADICDTATDALLTFTSWERWDQDEWRDFGLGHGLIGTSLAYDWLYTHLSTEQRATVRSVLAERAEQMYEAAIAEDKSPDWNNWWRRGYMQNHNHTNYAGLGLAGLALLAEDDRAETWIEAASENMGRLQTILDGGDGAWQEGIFYGDYGVSMSLAFTSNLRAITSTDLIPRTYLANYARWRTYNYIPESREVLMAYGDLGWNWAHEHRSLAVLRSAASENQDGHAAWIAERVIEEMERVGWSRSGWLTIHTAFEYLAYDPTVTPVPPTDFPLAHTLTDLEGVIWRTGWEADDLIFGLKASPLGGRFAFDAFTQSRYPFEEGCTWLDCGINTGHYHEDAGTFYLQKGPFVLAREFEEYDGTQTSYHNTLLIDGQGQYETFDSHERDAFRDSDPYLEASVNTPAFDYVAVNLTQPYTKNGIAVDRVVRHVVFMRPHYFLMVDDFQAADTHRYEWVAHFDGTPEVTDDWVRVAASENDLLGVQVVQPDAAAIETGNDGRPYVRIRPAEDTANARLVHLLVPSDELSWGSRPTAEVIAETDTTITIRVTDGPETTDILLDLAENAVQLGTNHLINGGFEEREGGLLPDGWVPRNLEANDRTYCIGDLSLDLTPYVDADSCIFAFFHDQNRGLNVLSQEVMLEGQAGDIITLQANIGALNLPANRAGMRIQVIYADGTSDIDTVYFAEGTYVPDSTYRQFFAQVIAAKDYERVMVFIGFNPRDGRPYLGVDSVGLYR